MKRFLNLRQQVRSLVLAMLATALIAAMFASALPARGQAGVTRTDAVVFVNSASTAHADFARYIQPYLDHFGVPYTIVDIAIAPVPSDLQNYALIIIGHNQLDPQHTYLDASEQLLISSAVNAGSGLLNFDSVLADPGFDPYYQYAQTIFGFDYAAATSASNVSIHSAATLGNYVIAAQPTNAAYTLQASITPLRVTLSAPATAVANIGATPLLIVTTYGQGRAVQWTSYEWMQADVWGYMRGFDDLVWRGLVWAARKPFVMQGLPPFITMRVDDVQGPYWWVDTANQYGWRPWGGLFIDTAQDIPHLKSLVDAGNMTVSIHARSDSLHFYYFLQDQASVDQMFAAGTAWHDTNEIAISKYVVPHYYQIDPRMFSYMRANWGVEFVGTIMIPGNGYFNTPRLMMGPFNRYETACNTECSAPVYYADYLDIPGFPALEGQYFNVLSEVRDITGYEWAPDNSVGPTINRGVAWLKRALDGMELASLMTHEYYIQAITPSNWTAIISGVTSGIAAYQPEFVTMDYAAQYLRAMRTSNIASSVYNPIAQQLSTTLTGTTDLPTRFYVFTESGGAIQGAFVNVPTFSNSVIVNQSLQPPTPTATATPGPSPTPSPTPIGPTATSTPTATPSTLPVINVWEDNHQQPVLPTTTNAADLVETDNQWTEFLNASRGYPGVFASTQERPPVMRFYASVPNGTYTLIANLYHNAHLRYYWGTSATTPEEFSFDATTGPNGEFQEYILGTITVSNGVFEIFVDRADLLPGGGAYPFWGWAWIRLATPVGTPVPTNTPIPPTSTPINTPTPSATPTATATPTAGPPPVINVWEDNHQQPVLPTTTNAADLVETDNQWTEFLYASRGYPGVFASTQERPPVMRFYASVPNGTYTLIANLYHNAHLRYYWGTSATTPEEFSFDATTGPNGEFQEYILGTITVSNGVFEIFVDRADLLLGGGAYPFWGWAWIRLVTPVGTPVPTNTPIPPTSTPINTPTPSATPTATATPTAGPPPVINVWEDNHQQPVLPTTTNAADLVETDNQWTEFLYASRGYPGVFASTQERPPVMRFYASVPNGTYTLIANLYHNAHLRYYWGTSATTPEEFSFDATTGPNGEFQEYILGTITVSNGVFEIFVDRADLLLGGGAYPFWGWAWIRLVTPVGTPAPTNTPTATSTSTPSATATPTPTNTPTNTLTATSTSTPSATATSANTGFRNPAANAVQSGGDNNGFQTSPTSAYVSDNVYAVDTNSGTSTSTSCTNSGKDRHAFYTYNLSVPSNASILGIEVRLDARVDSTSGSPRMCVQLSWDGGATWTAAKTTSTLSTTRRSDTLGGIADTWGRIWTANNLSNANFRVRITNVASSTARDFSLDWIVVRVTYR